MSDLCTVHQMEDCPVCMRDEIDSLRALLRKSHQNCLAMWEALEGGPSPRCRDCADFNGRCQGKGKACDPQERAMEQIKLLRSSVEQLKLKADERWTALDQIKHTVADNLAAPASDLKMTLEFIQHVAEHTLSISSTERGHD